MNNHKNNPSYYSEDLLNLLPESIVVTDINGIVIKWLGSSVEFFDYAINEITGLSIERVFNQTIYEDFYSKVLKTVSEKGEFYGEIPCLTKKGKEKSAELKIKKYKEPGFQESFIFIFIDRTDYKKEYEAISAINYKLKESYNDQNYHLTEAIEEFKFENEERKRTQDELIALKNELMSALDMEKESNETKSKFISMISHNYRTPLTVILSSVDLLDEYKKRERYDTFDKHFNKIRESVKSMVSLLEGVTALNKTDSDKMQMKKEELELVSLVDSFINEIKYTDKNNHIFEFTYNVERINITTDKNILHQAVVNVLNNAVKYSPTNSKIKVNIFSNDQHVSISVIDNGIGIPKQDAEYLFEPFQRGSNIGNIQGSGLGLAIVKRSCNLLKAYIDVESSVGKGSNFTIKIDK